MALELADALKQSGAQVAGSLHPNARDDWRGTASLFFNFPTRLEDLPAPLRSPGAGGALMQFFVDHPLALDTHVMDGLSDLSHFRLVLPCMDSAHLLRLRWPRLKYVHCFHAVPPRAIADEASIERRWSAAPGDEACDVVVAGSIHSEQELQKARAGVPSNLRSARADLVSMLVEHPHMPFEQAADLVLSAAGQSPGDWPLLSALWRSVTPEVNRIRRVALVESLRGMNAVVYGGDAWKEFCTGSIRHGGNLPYRDLPAALARGRVCLAWGPTQFAHSFSERLLLSMAAGCATVTDDRWIARRVFGGQTGRELAMWYDPRNPASARGVIEGALASPSTSIELARRGRAEIANRHLWRHRVQLLAALARDAAAGDLSLAA